MERKNTQTAHEYLEEGQQAYLQWRDALMAKPEVLAFYQQEVARNGLSLQPPVEESTQNSSDKLSPSRRK